MYEALVNKDSSFEGSFIAAVKTTGIFCRPTCTARKPKEENVEFFSTTKDAILHGYRPCKVCHPLEMLNETPEFVKNILQQINDWPSEKIKDWHLREKNIDPNKVRRWFLKNNGLTFHAYQRMFRINSAFKKIQNGETITSTAFDSGYESMSGFHDSFKSIFGVSPSNSRQQQVIDITRMETPLGTMFACAVEQGICLLEFTDRKMLETELKALAKLLNATIIQGSNKHFVLLKQQLEEYFFRAKEKYFPFPCFLPDQIFNNTFGKFCRKFPMDLPVHTFSKHMN